MRTVPNLKQVLGKELRKARKSIPKLTQEKVADALGNERSYISRIERGIILPSLNVLVLLGEILNVPASVILKQVEEELKLHDEKETENFGSSQRFSGSSE